MLKVVGASWGQTRITMIILGAVTLVGLLTYLYGENTSEDYDGKYAATVYWSRTAGYRLQFWGQNNNPAVIKKGVARAYYSPDMTADGWASMEIETAELYPDTVQVHAAGLLEGSLSWQLIYYHWKNTVENFCEDKQDFCEQARIILDQNTANVREKAKALDSFDPFWHQVNLFYEQLDGLEVGWRYGVDRSRKDFDIPHADFLWMNMACDLRDLELMYNTTLDISPNRPSLSMALLKLLPNDSSQFLLAHASSSLYSAMLRVQKRYHFGLHMTGTTGTGKVPGQVVAFTSYPGSIHSQDDFYRVLDSGSTSARLTVSGTSIKNLNQSLWAEAGLTDQVLMGPRVMAANRVAQNASEWASQVARSNSGTGNKQWLVVQSGGSRVKLWVVEQLPSITQAAEQTARLNATGFWASYGLPHYKRFFEAPVDTFPQEILDLSDNRNQMSQSAKTVAKVLSEGQTNVTDLESLICLMRSPDLTIIGRSDLSIEDIQNLQEEYQNHLLHSTTEITDSTEISNEIPHSNEHTLKEKISPPHFAHNVKEVFNTIISMKRLSEELKLMEKNSNIKSSDDSTDESVTKNELPEIDLLINKRKVINDDTVLPLREFSGVIDLKVSENNGFLAAAGPPFSKRHGTMLVQPFQWSKSAIKELPHVGQADFWNFDPVAPEWVWN